MCEKECEDGWVVCVCVGEKECEGVSDEGVSDEGVSCVPEVW